MTSLTATCVHWWRIQPPAGPTSKARCKRCKATRYFVNVDPEFPMSKCRVCGRFLPFNKDSFTQAPHGGLTSVCKECKGVRG